MQKEGVILAVEGASQFITQMKAAGQAVDGFGKAVGGSANAAKLQTWGASLATVGSALQNLTGLGGGIAQLGGKMGSLGQLAGVATKYLGAAGPAIAGVGVAAAGSIAALGGAAVGVAALGKKMAELAQQTAPIQGLDFQFRTLTQEIEGGSGAMLSALQRSSSGMIANRDLMRSYNDAAALVNRQFAERLPEALGLLGKVSAATGTDMNYLLNSLVTGVGRVSPMILDNLKIQVGVAEATAKASEMFGKEADQLTKVEQQTALTELALAKLEEKFGALPDISETAGAQMAMLQANFQNIKDTLGQFLLPAFTSFLQGVNALTGAFSAAISEGGAFYPLLVNLGAVLALVGDGFRDLADRAAHWLGNLDADWTARMGGMAASAIQWGADLVTNFAVGILDAANTVLTWAMNQIGNILSWWLAPGSPPKVAPDLDKWGIAAFESFLKGMTEADFGVLESVQGPLKKALEGPAFADVSKALSGALAGGDRAGALNILAKSSEQFGDDIAELARREFALADATDAVAVAEQKLADAQERAVRTNQRVSAETAKYNQMLREGASEQALQAQLARINAAEEEANVARKEVGAAETGVDAAKEQVDALKEQVEWQQRFLQQLFGIQDALTEQERRGSGAGKGAVIPGLPEGALRPAAGGIGGAIAQAIEDAKGRIKTSLGGIWQTIKEEFSDKWDAAIAKLGGTWTEFKDTVGEAWDTLKEKYPFLQNVEDWLVDNIPVVKQMIVEAWDPLTESLGGLYSEISDNLLGVLTGDQSLLEAFQNVRDYIKDTFIPEILGEDGLGPILQWFKDEVIDPLATGIDTMYQALKNSDTWLGNLIKRIEGMGPGFWDKIKFLVGQSPSPLAIGIQTAADAMERMARVSIPQLQGAMTFQPAGMGSSFRPAGSVTNQTANSFSFDTTVNSGIDAVAFEAMILRTVRRALAGAA